MEMPLSFLHHIQSWSPWLVGPVLVFGLGLLTWPVIKKLLTPSGLFHAWILGVLVWGTLNWPGFLVVVFYFLAGSGVTKIGMAEKEAAGIAENRSGARGPENVWGSALVGTICALGYWLFPEEFKPLLALGYVASFSTKLSDTTATEIGKAFGQRTFLITTLRPVPRGTEGAVSLEGTVAGIVGSIAIAIIGWAVGLISPVGIGLCAIAAFIATSIESVIGATIEGRLPGLTHDVVNVLNTLIGATGAIALQWMIASMSS
jgi:uncharacterized protein (TIGR00297 family)